MNWWLMALSFVLGVLFTLAFTIRRVTRDVPIYAALGRGPRGEAAEPERPAAESEKAEPVPDMLGDSGSDTRAMLADLPPGPYGAGSAMPGAGGAGPPGWTVKADEHAMLYHTAHSPSYDQTTAEIWFVDEAAASKAGFTRWDTNKN